MATPKQNYARQFQAYAQGIEPNIPAGIRTYSVFNPDTGTWQRMTNGFRSPIPVQGQPVVPVQESVQRPSRGSVRPSPASGEGGASVSLFPASEASQRASQRGFKTSGQLNKYLSVGKPTALQPVTYPERYRAVVSPDHQEPAYSASTPITPAVPAETAQEYGFRKLALINPMLAYVAGALKTLPKVAPAIFWNPDNYTDHSDPRW